VEIAASQFAEWDIGMEMCRWRNVGMSEKLGIKSVYLASVPNSSFTVNRLFKDLATVVHSEGVGGSTYGLTNTKPFGRNKMKYSRTKTKIVINVPVIFNDQIYALDRAQLLKGFNRSARIAFG
jgi:hypothetical protein